MTRPTAPASPIRSHGVDMATGELLDEADRLSRMTSYDDLNGGIRALQLRRMFSQGYGVLLWTG